MALDGFTLAAVAAELRDRLVGGRVERIYQPGPRDLEIRVRAGGQSRRLWISADPEAARIHTVEGLRVPGSGDPPPFCALIRRHLEGGRIRYIRQVGLERVLRIGVESRNDLGDPVWYDLVVEIMGRHSNAVVVRHEDDSVREREGPPAGRILDALVRVVPGMSRHRVVLPGQAYVPPPEQHKIDPRAESEEQFRRWQASLGRRPEPADLIRRYQGIGPVLAEEIAWRANRDAPPGGGDFWTVFREMVEDLSAGRFRPCVALSPEGGPPKAVSAVYLSHLSSRGPVEVFDSANEAVERFYASRLEEEGPRRAARNLAAVVREALKNLEARIRQWEEQLREAEDAERYRRMGELLTAYLHTVPRGASEVTVPDPYSEEGRPTVIPLNPEWSPAENAQALFRQYQKRKRTREVVGGYLEQARRDAEYLESVLVSLENAEGEELEEIREELQQQGFLKSRKPAGRKREAAADPLHFVSSEGIDIYVGRNNRQNDWLTLKMAHKNDTWLHAQQIPGSHVVVRSRNVPPKTLEEAACLAAYYSKARHSANVPVDYTLVKHVWKPNGARPGFVLYDHQRTVFVTPDPALPERLRARPVARR
ncbi:MAG: NFACT RNA binding domain-containing protein [Alicyclobacillaceae bacterium]|nr:NFACT RNA binding domain-containing protein [Alicyclobacillaceae bacterium]